MNFSPKVGGKTEKETWTNYFSSTFRRYRQTPCTLIRVKAHAISMSISTFTLVCFFYFGEISETRIKSGRFNFYMSFSLNLVHRQCVFEFYAAKVSKNAETKELFGNFFLSKVLDSP